MEDTYKQQEEVSALLLTLDYETMLQVTLQSKLETNIRILADAISKNAAATNTLKQKVSCLEAQGNDNLRRLDGVDKIIDRKIKESVDQNIKELVDQKIDESLRRNESMRRNNAKKQTEGKESNRQTEGLKETEMLQESEMSKDIQNKGSNEFSKQQEQIANKSSGYDSKIISELRQQLQAIKKSIPNVDLLEQALGLARKDINALKGELAAMCEKGGTRRESIGVSKKDLEAIKSSKSRRQLPSNKLVSLPSNHSAVQSISQNALNLSLRQAQIEEEPRFSVPSQGCHESGKQNSLKTGKEQAGSDGNRDRELNSLRIDISTLQICYEQLRQMLGDVRKKESKGSGSIADLVVGQKKLQVQLIQNTEIFDKKIRDLLEEINRLQDIGSVSQTQAVNVSESRTGNEAMHQMHQRRTEESINYKNSLNDRFSKLQSAIASFVTQEQLTRFKNQVRSRLAEIEQEHGSLKQEWEEETLRVWDGLKRREEGWKESDERMETIASSLRDVAAQADRKHNIAVAKVDELRKNMQNLREDIEFYQNLASQGKAQQPQAQIVVIDQPSTHTKQVIERDSKPVEDLKKHFLGKLQEQRVYLLGIVRDLERRTQNANLQTDLANIWERLNELGLLTGKKADAEDTRKNLVYLQKKISRISGELLRSQEDETEDARAARKGWFCLSCDKGLTGYQGKVGKHIVWDSMPLKGISKEFDKDRKEFDKDRKALPSLKREKAA